MFIQNVCVLFIVCLYVYVIISRICQCVEHCATAKAYSRFRENALITINDVNAGILKSNKEKHDVAERLS